MGDQLLYIIEEYLSLTKYRITSQDLKKRLYSDPDDGVVAITNTLDFFAIKNIVADVPKDSYNELPQSFISQISRNNQFKLVLVTKERKNKIKICVDNKTSVYLSKDDFFINWTGLIIAIEDNQNPNFQKNIKKSILKGVLFGCSLLSLGYIALVTSSFFKFIYFALSIVGLIISYYIILEKLGLKSTASKFCSLTKKTDCQTVLNSNEAKIFNFLELSDASIVYFSFLIFSFTYSPNNICFFFLSVASLPMILYSVFYQYFKINKWCPLCLGIASILAIQFLVLLPVFQKELYFDRITIIPVIFILGLLVVSWYFIKTLVVSNKESENLIIENLKFRRNYKLFLPYYNSLRKIEGLKDSNCQIKIGINNPLITLTVVTNPFCKSCYEAHSIYMSLLEKHSNLIQINFLFLVPFNNRNDKKTQVSERLIQLYFEKGQDVFVQSYNEWFKNADFKLWTQKWGNCNDVKLNKVLIKHTNWCLNNEIDSTPAILINGKLFPQTYQPNDIENFMENILEVEKNKIKNGNSAISV